MQLASSKLQQQSERSSCVALDVSVSCEHLTAVITHRQSLHHTELVPQIVLPHRFAIHCLAPLSSNITKALTKAYPLNAFPSHFLHPPFPLQLLTTWVQAGKLLFRSRGVSSRLGHKGSNSLFSLGRLWVWVWEWVQPGLEMHRPATPLQVLPCHEL